MNHPAPAHTRGRSTLKELDTNRSVNDFLLRGVAGGWCPRLGGLSAGQDSRTIAEPAGPVRRGPQRCLIGGELEGLLRPDPGFVTHRQMTRWARGSAPG